jgi:hypothetical protein
MLKDLILDKNTSLEEKSQKIKEIIMDVKNSSNSIENKFNESLAKLKNIKDENEILTYTEN